MLPGLTQLPVTRTGAPPTEAPRADGGPRLDDLPAELLGLVIRAIDSDNPCMAVLSLCGSNEEWKFLCNQDGFYDVVNYNLGYYGQLGTWKAMVEHYERLGREPAATPLAYFKEACKFRRSVQQAGGALYHVPAYRPDYGEIAKLAVQQAGVALYYVPKNRADYGEIAKLAVQQAGDALYYVPKNHPDYGEIAKLAVQQPGNALYHVPTNRADYGEIAKLAVQQDGNALRHVPMLRPDYGEIAQLAV